MKTPTRKPTNIEQMDKLMAEIHPLQVAFDRMADHVIITDENANIIYANPAAEKNTGFAIHEMIGKNPAELWGGRMSMDF